MLNNFFAVTVFTLSALTVSAADIVFTSENQNIKVEELTSQSDVVWGFDFLDDQQIIFTTRSGSIKIFNQKTKKVSEVKGAPAVVSSQQAGLLDIRVYPKDKKRIFLTYVKAVEDNSAVAMGFGQLENGELKNFKEVFVSTPANDGGINFGSRLEFDIQGNVYVTIGDRDQREPPQNLNSHLGKILRFTADGGIPADNPFTKENTKEKKALPEVWTLGHRNPQGIAFNASTGELWSVEMGPRGGDELNHIKPGLNYGWPIISYGKEYSGFKVGKGITEKAGMQQPVAHWVPSISPSGMTIYTKDQFPKWKGNILFGTLNGMHLRRIVLDGQKVVKQEELLKDWGVRIRNVKTGQDGFVYLSTDDGKIARLVPVTKGKSK